MCDTHNGRQRWVGCAAALLAVAGVTLHAAALPAQEPITVDNVIARAAAYVETFVEELSTVVMEEEYLWVPVEMRETYSERGAGTINATARYRNYRQFSVTVSENSDAWTEPPAEPDGPE